MRSYLVILSVALALSACTSSRPPELPEPARVLVTHSRAQWGAQPPVLAMRVHEPRRITIHHTATYQQPERSIEEKMRALQQFSQRDDSLASGQMKPVWADVPYHFYVDVHGQVAEGRAVGYEGDTNTGYDPAGHVLIVVEGNFQEEEATPEQLATLHRLVPVLARHWEIPAGRIASHRDFADTSCPGEHLYALLPELRAQ